MKIFLAIIFSVVFISTIMINSEGIIPAVSIYINGTSSTSESFPLEFNSPKFFVEDYPESILIEVLISDPKKDFELVSIKDPLGAIAEYNLPIDKFNQLEHLVSITKDSPLGEYWFYIGTPDDYMAAASFEIQSQTKDESAKRIPLWVKNVFVWYGQDKISENELLSAIEYLINNGIIKISNP